MSKKLDTSRLTDDEVQALKATLWGGAGGAVAPRAVSVEMAPLLRAATASAAAAGPAPLIVAEGDSWFDYLPGLDILDQLKLQHGHVIHKLARAGDTIENIAFGTQVDRAFGRPEPQINVLVNQVDTFRPRVVLISGGGNDVAGDEFAAFLNHADSGLPLLREAYVKDVIHGMVRRAYERIAREVWKVDPTIAVLTHGYGHAIPDGRAVLNFPFGFRFIGPWLKPALFAKNITQLSVGKGIVKAIIDEFNTMLETLQGELPGPFRHVDLRPIIKAGDWVNELHVNNDCHARCARKFHQAIQEMTR